MNFGKKSKIVILITAIFTAVVCVCFLISGAYAVPSAADGSAAWKGGKIKYGRQKEVPPAADGGAVWKGGGILNELLAEDGVYYIFCDGAGENDKPQASVSVGSVEFVLVRKDGYTSIGPFDNMETLMEDVAKQCGSMKNLTTKERELVVETAAGIYGNAGLPVK